jgi:hypothetical protein
MTKNELSGFKTHLKETGRIPARDVMTAKCVDVNWRVGQLVWLPEQSERSTA